MNDKPQRPTQTGIIAPTPVIGLSFDAKLTAAHPAALAPEQITELFQAVHTVAALTELAEKKVAGQS